MTGSAAGCLKEMRLGEAKLGFELGDDQRLGFPVNYFSGLTEALPKAELKDGVRGDPLVQAVLTRFPGAEIVDVRPPAGAPAASADDASSEELPDVPQNEGDPDA